MSTETKLKGKRRPRLPQTSGRVFPVMNGFDNYDDVRLACESWLAKWEKWGIREFKNNDWLFH
jgi:hypothetical protein